MQDGTNLAISKIPRFRSSPRSLSSAKAGERESSPVWTKPDPRLRGGDNAGDFHFFRWAAGPWTLRTLSRLLFRHDGAQRKETTPGVA